MNILALLLSSRVKAEILRLLFGVEARSLHLREIARRSGLAVGTVQQELKRLSGIGLIADRLDGNRRYYSANAEHPLYPDLCNIVLKTTGLVDVLREALTHRDIRVAFVFGSVARGKEMAHSDIDLMIIGTVSLRQTSKLLSGVAGKIGREINPHVFTAEEFQQRINNGDHFLMSALDTPRLHVIGNEHELEAVGGKRLVASA